jgi:3-oxo-4-pregnene-20-carboxyl-CoA dehydrogenase beta subunit
MRARPHLRRGAFELAPQPSERPGKGGRAARVTCRGSALESGAMFIDYTDEQKALRRKLRAYFEELIPPETRAKIRPMEGGPVVRDLIRRMGRDGWLGVGWPVEYGGRGYGAVEQQIFVNEVNRAEIPYPVITLQTVGPTLMRFGNTQQKDFFLPRILAGEIHFAIGYTEPGAGTDLASLRTRAVLDGTEYVVNGQKLYTTGGHTADYIWASRSSSSTRPRRASPGPRSSPATAGTTPTPRTTATCAYRWIGGSARRTRAGG